MKKLILFFAVMTVSLTTYSQATFSLTTQGENYNTNSTPVTTGASFAEDDIPYQTNSNHPQIMITHSLSQDITPGDEIACASTSSFRDNNLYRHFDLVGQFGITKDFHVENVEVAIGHGVITPSGFPMTLKILSHTGAAFPGGVLTELASEVIIITAADSATIVNVPINATIPFGENMVFEVEIIDDGTESNFMRFGVNLFGQTGISWIKAADCGTGIPTDLVSLNLLNSFIMNVYGVENTPLIPHKLIVISPDFETEKISISMPSELIPNSVVLRDVNGIDTGLTFAGGEIDISSLGAGTYFLTVDTHIGVLTQTVIKN